MVMGDFKVLHDCYRPAPPNDRRGECSLLLVISVPLVDVNALWRFALPHLDPFHKFGIKAGEVQDRPVVCQLPTLRHALFSDHKVDDRLRVRMESHAHCLSPVHTITPIIGLLLQLSILYIVDIFAAYCYTMHVLYEVTPYVPSVSGKHVMSTLLLQSSQRGREKSMKSFNVLMEDSVMELLTAALVIGTALLVVVVIAAAAIEVRS